ncbi:hypothetical protein [Jiella mangrovi]|uniref:DUF4239 domain-containing protein n=1 Tax=Jiella mangrovi TaxID=2821407 RepID=A0ABS4BIZ3_9HYPH|nr:hypothetical protein [Jiella mangrovi]MBP0616734.1 hypothetical protein [Jiella mangrovi]
MKSLAGRRGAALIAPRAIDWEAIAAGAFLAIVIEFAASLAGFGLFEQLSSVPLGAISGPVFSAAGLFAVAGTAVALFVGGFASARLAGTREAGDAVLCGTLTFCLASLVTVVLLTANPPTLLDRGLGPVSAAVSALSAARDRSPQPRSGERQTTRDEIQRFLDDADALRGGGRSQRDMASDLAAILRGVDETASPDAEGRALEAITTASGVTEPVAERRLIEWQRANDLALADARRASGAVAGDLAASCFAAFVALFAALLAAMAGAIVGRPRRELPGLLPAWR